MSEETNQQMKMLLIVRSDLKMRSGKIGAQCGHAVANFYRSLRDIDLAGLIENEEEWYNKNGQRKITLAVNSEEDLLHAKSLAEKALLNCHLIRDSGLTEFHGVPTNTVLLIGPYYDKVIDPLFGPDSEMWLSKRLRLY